MRKALIVFTLLSSAANAQERLPASHSINGHSKAVELYRQIDGIPQPSHMFKSTGRALLWEVNVYVNARITYTNETKGVDVWQAPITTEALRQGDCEDYAAYKMELLKQNGIPERDMYLVVGVNTDGEAHAVLSVDMDGVTYSLDNNTNSVEAGRVMAAPLYAINRFGFALFK